MFISPQSAFKSRPHWRRSRQQVVVDFDASVDEPYRPTAGLCPDPPRELTALPIPSSLGGLKGETRREGWDGVGRRREEEMMWMQNPACF